MQKKDQSPKIKTQYNNIIITFKISSSYWIIHSICILYSVLYIPNNFNCYMISNIYNDIMYG